MPPKYLILSIVVCSTLTYSCSETSPRIQLEKKFEKALDSSQDSLLYYATDITQGANESNKAYSHYLAKILSGYHYWRIFQLDTARQLLNSCDLYFSNSEHHGSLNHGRTLFYLSMVELRGNNTLKARIEANRALEIFQGLNHTRYIIKTHSLLGGIENNLDNYEKSLEHHLLGLQFLQDPKSEPWLARNLFHNLSGTYLKINNYKKALKYAQGSLKLSKETENVNGEINSLNSIGAIHAALDNIDSAIYYYQESGNLALEINNYQMYLASQYNISNTYSNSGALVQSNDIIEQLLENQSPIPNYWLSSLLTTRAKNHLQLKNYDQALGDARKATSILQSKEAMQLHVSNTKILWNAFELKGESDSALKYAKAYFIARDSIVTNQTNKEITELRIGIETLDKENQIGVLEAEKKIAQTKMKVIILGSISTLSIAAFVFLSYRYQQQLRASKLELETLNLNKELEKNKQLLSNLTLSIVHKNNGLSDIENQLDNISGEGKSRIKSIIKVNRSLEKDWEIFINYFSKIHKDFFKILTEKHGSFTVLEKRLAALIKLSLTNKELSSLLGIEIKSINMARYRLKKKLCLTDEDNLDDYLITLGDDLFEKQPAQ